MMNISNKAIFVFVFVGLVLAVIVSVFVSKQLSNTVSMDVKKRDQDVIFGAVESGPLAIARLQSAAIAQEELNRLMSHNAIANRGVVGVSIYGGEGFSFTFASWNLDASLASNCIEVSERIFPIKDSIFPFKVKLQSNSCFVPPEEAQIFKYSWIAGLCVALGAILLLAMSIWPVAFSIKKATDVLSSKDQANMQNIYFQPIRDLVGQALRSVELERNAAFAELAAQVSHDIRSPVSALNILLATASEIPAEKREIAKRAADRINEIANILLRKSRDSSVNIEKDSKKMPKPKTEVGESLSAITTEKLVQFADRPELQIVYDKAEGLKANVEIDPVEFQRMISNLLNNSIEALDPSGKVSIKVVNAGNQVQIVINDNGKGIPQHILDSVGRKGFSYGKEATQSGSGLGIFHAIETIKSANGKFDIASKVGQGTEVSILLPVLS